MNLRALGSGRVLTVAKDTGLDETARLMRERHVGDVIVVDEKEPGRPVGILTDRDIVMATLAVGAPATALAAGDVMTATLVTVREGEGLGRVISLMKENGVRRMPIVDDNGKLVGILTLQDVMTFLAAELSDLAAVGRRQTELEKMRRRKLA